ncbi:hypothetical protein DFP73DRAFT_633348 [Morchella snyderi]|nr:hypothetical protein DFP73DRAFT_633348 [Morchella snyderi]
MPSGASVVGLRAGHRADMMMVVRKGLRKATATTLVKSKGGKNPGPQLRPSTELTSESGHSHPNTLASSPEGSCASPVDTDRSNGHTVYPRIGSFFHKPYPFQLPSVTAQGPSNYYSICRERERWEFAVETRPERHGEGASCLPHLREIYSSTPSLSVPNSLPYQQLPDAPNPETVSSGLQPVSEDSLNQTHQAALSPHSVTENRLQSIARSSDEAEYDWWNESGVVRTPPPETFWAPEQEATKWEEAQQERNRRFRLELSPQEVIRRRSTGPNPIKNELLC